MPPIKTEGCDRSYAITDVYLLVMLTVFPLFTGIGGYVFLHRKKFFFFIIATLLWVACLLIETVRRAKRGGQFSRPRLPEWLVLAFLLAATASTLASPYASFLYVGGRYDSLLTHLLYGAVLAGVYRYGRPRLTLLYAFAAAYAVCCGVALLQLCGFNALWLFPDGVNYYDPYVQETGRFLGTVGNIDLLAALHCLALPLLTTALLHDTHPRRFALLLPLAMGLACAAAARVAAGLLALGLAAALFLPGALLDLYRARTGRDASELWRGAGFVLLAAALAAVFFLTDAAGSLYELQRLLHGEVRDEFGSHRILIWRRVLEVVGRHPLLGVGPDSLWHYLDIRFERWSPALGETLATSVDYAHSEYLQLLANFGVLGALPLAALAVYTVRRIARAGDGAADRWFVPCLFCYLVQGLFNTAFCILTPVALILWGLLLAHCDGMGTEEPDRGPTGQGAKKER